MEALIALLGLTVLGYAVFTSIDATGLLLKPDFESPWHDMTAQAGNHTTLLSIAHGLGVAPLLVDVQVLVPSGGNKGYIFPGSGCRPRDDDEPEGYGGIIYIYNHVYVKISSPTQANQNLGRCIYTGQSPYWEGPYSTDTYTAKVRVRAWKKATLPPVDFSESGIMILCGNSSVSYVERSHGLGDYPALVISRTKFPPSSTKTYPNYYSDSVGASMGMSDGTSNQNSFVVYGFSKNTIRAWAPTASSDHIFAGDDGWNFDTVDSGEMEFYAWKQSSLTPNITGTLTLGQSVLGSSLKANFSYIGNTTATYTKAWVQSSSGSNSGFRFVGNGNLAYDETATAAGCSFGGLLYAYHDNSIRFWQPGPGSGSSNGALICIADKMGGGRNVQASFGGVAIYYSWTLDTDDCVFLHCLNGGTCTNYAGGYTCTCVAGYEGINCQTALNVTTEASSTVQSTTDINNATDRSTAGSSSMTSTTIFETSSFTYTQPYSTSHSTSFIPTTESPTTSSLSTEPSTTFGSSRESSTTSASSEQPSTTNVPSRQSSTTSRVSTQPSNVTVSTTESSTKSNSPPETPPTTSSLSTQTSTTSTLSTKPSTTYTSSTEPQTTSTETPPTTSTEPQTTSTETPPTTSTLSTKPSTTYTSSIEPQKTSTETLPTTSTLSTQPSTTYTSSTEPQTTTTETLPTTSTLSTQPSTTYTSSTEPQTTSTTARTPSSPTPVSSVFTSDAPTTPIPDCGNPPFLDLGWRQYNGTSRGSVAEYFCRPGYNINGSDSISCQENGTWETLDAVCLPVDCGPLNVSTDGSITYIPTSTTHFGSVATFQCRPGFLIFNTINSATFFCSENGIWEGNLSLVCNQVFCEDVMAPNNGGISGSDNSVGSVVMYNCTDGYTLDGYRSRVCLSSGTWSGRTPLCKLSPTKQAEPCPDSEDYRGLLWYETEPGQIYTVSCSEQNNNLTGEITRKCTDTGEWLLPHYNCVRKEIEAIQEVVNAIKDKPTAENVENVLSQLSSLTDQQEQSTYSGEIKVVTSTLEVIANIDYTNITLTQDQNAIFLETTSNLLDLSNAESWQAIDEQSAETGESSGASKVLDVVSTYTDAIANSLDESEENRTIIVSNLVLQVRRLNDSEDVTFPTTDDFPNISTALSLSQTSLQGSTTYSAVLYKNLTGVLSTNASFGSQNLEIGSSVMSVKLDQWEKVDDFKITITFQHFQTRRQLATCSYRNESRNVWEKGGCRVKHSNSSETVCECDHLTNFAILMSPWTENNVDTEAIRIISIVGCSVSILCLIVTMIAHLWYWKYVKSDRVKILMNLCFAMIVSYGIFLGGVDRTSNKDACTTVAVLLQYIYLVVFFLMLAEGIEISVIVLYVFTTKSRLKWMLPSAWLLPALVVGISLAVTQTKGYGNNKACWLSIDNGLIWAFVGPALLIILVNVILIVLVMKAIFKTKKLSQKSNKERTITGLRCLCVLLPLVGCTWVIGIFYVNEDMAWIQYVFAICNGLQGMAIFIFHCALNTQIRNAYKRKHKYSQSASATRSTSNPLLIPRPTPSLSSTESNVYFNISFGEETHQRRKHIHGGHEDRIIENLEMKRQPYTLDNFYDSI